MAVSSINASRRKLRESAMLAHRYPAPARQSIPHPQKRSRRCAILAFR
jgi:hypothetical protein